VKVDLALTHDGSGPAVLRLLKQGGRTPADSSRVVVTLDHCFPAPTVKDREFHREIDEFAGRHNIILFKNGEGVLHQVVAEEESLWPGMIIVGADGHVSTSGAFGAIALSLEPAPFVEAVVEGWHRMSVPEQVVISIDGHIDPRIMARDVALHVTREYGKLLRGKAVLLTGGTIDAMNISQKMSLCNFLPETGAATALVLPQGEQEPVDIHLSAEDLEPMLAIPGLPLAIDRAGSCAGKKITAAIAGGCSSGRLDDMQVIAGVLAKNEVHPDVTFIITPASRSVLGSMDRMDLSAVLRNSGAVILPPGCGPCPGNHFGVLSDGDVAITTTVRNTPGRIGAAGARIYLASPLTVALSAVHGAITVAEQQLNHPSG
jgi:3-isopropylmalate/(R)-2-methylmalate dehydratase large subunit